MWINLFTFCSSFILVMSLAFCLCWRRKQKSEWPGVPGVITNKPDENVNHILPDVFEDLHYNQSNKRQTVPSTTRRSLPDIPAESGTVNWEPSGDNSSEHYATVGQYEHSLKRHTIANGIETKPSISQHSSLSQADSPYERVKYDLIKNKEHPYAQLQPTARANLSENRNILEEVPVARNEIISEPGPSSRVSNDSGMLDIPAATAVAGGIAASPDLPYMTPPIAQTNFSGDSQDSSKGYTSISVREPLVNIIAQTKESNKRKIDPHYSTVSDDSDDVYTTIPDPNQVYTSESETYAKIPQSPITVEAEINQVQRTDSDEVDDAMYESASQPVPPSVDSLKHVTHYQTHSRQASSSSSTANIGSPKPEKRQANSPLPPTPPILPDGEKLHNIDDLYAKVQKIKSKSSDEDSSPEKPINPISNKLAEHSYETLRKPNDHGYEKIKNDEPGYASLNGPESISSSDPGYEVLKPNSDPNYEELKYRKSGDLPGYAKIKDNDPFFGYSVVNKAKKKAKSQEYSLADEPNYESMPSESVSDINYSGLKSSESETDPNYESVSQNDPNYECVGYKGSSEKTDITTDSNLSDYERVNSRGYDILDTSESSDSMSKSKNRAKDKLEDFSSKNQIKNISKDSNSSFEKSSSEKSNCLNHDDIDNDATCDI